MNEAQHRTKIGKIILVSNLLFGVIIIILYVLRGFTDEEFTEIMRILAPINSIYLTALIRYVTAHKNILQSSSKATINKLFAVTSYWLIMAHISSLILITTLYALWNLMTFDVLLNMITAIETFFGVYVGLIISSMFRVKTEPTTAS